MAEDEGLQRMAEVPSLGRPIKGDGDFVALNKMLRACFVCRLVKTERQFIEAGCDNCRFLRMEDDRDAVTNLTTPNFTGMIAVINPKSSWATKWERLDKAVPGCYALAVNEDPPPRLRADAAIAAARSPSPLARAVEPVQVEPNPEHQLRLAYLGDECCAVIDALNELTALQLGGQAVFAGAATDLQRGADALRMLSEALVQGREEGEQQPEPAGRIPLEEALQEADSVLCTLGALQMEDQQRLIARTSRALRAMHVQLLRAPGPQALAGGACFKATIEAQQSWRSVATACRESSATVSECVSGLGLALSKLGSSRQQLLDGGLEADAVDEGDRWVAACIGALQQYASQGEQAAALEQIAARLGALQEGLKGKFGGGSGQPQTPEPPTHQRQQQQQQQPQEQEQPNEQLQEQQQPRGQQQSVLQQSQQPHLEQPQQPHTAPSCGPDAGPASPSAARSPAPSPLGRRGGGGAGGDSTPGSAMEPLAALLDDLVVQCGSLQKEMMALRREALDGGGSDSGSGGRAQGDGGAPRAAGAGVGGGGGRGPRNLLGDFEGRGLRSPGRGRSYTRYDNPLALAAPEDDPAGSGGGEGEREEAAAAPQAASEPASPTRLGPDAAADERESQNTARRSSGGGGAAAVGAAVGMRAAAGAASPPLDAQGSVAGRRGAGAEARGSPTAALQAAPLAPGSPPPPPARVAELFDALAVVHARCPAALRELPRFEALSGPDLRAWLAAGAECGRAAAAIGGAEADGRAGDALGAANDREAGPESLALSPNAPASPGSWRIPAVYTPGRQVDSDPAAPAPEARPSPGPPAVGAPGSGASADSSGSGAAGSGGARYAGVQAPPVFEGASGSHGPQLLKRRAQHAGRGRGSLLVEVPDSAGGSAQPEGGASSRGSNSSSCGGGSSEGRLGGASPQAAALSQQQQQQQQQQLQQAEEAEARERQHTQQEARLRAELAEARGQLEATQLQLRRALYRESLPSSARRRSGSLTGAPPLCAEQPLLAPGGAILEENFGSSGGGVGGCGADSDEGEDPLRLQQSVIEVLQQQVSAAQALALERGGEVRRLERQVSELGGIVVAAERAISGALGAEPRAGAVGAGAGAGGLRAEGPGGGGDGAAISRGTAGYERPHSGNNSSRSSRSSSGSSSSSSSSNSSGGSSSGDSSQISGRSQSPERGRTRQQRRRRRQLGSQAAGAGAAGAEAGSVELEIESSPDRAVPLLGRNPRYSDATEHCSSAAAAAAPATGALPTAAAAAMPASPLAAARAAAAAASPLSRSPSPTRLALEARLTQQGSAAQSRLRALLAAGGLPRPGGAGAAGRRLAIVGTVRDDGVVTLEPVADAEAGGAAPQPQPQLPAGQGRPQYVRLVEEPAGPEAAAAGATAAHVVWPAREEYEAEVARLRGELEAAQLRVQTGRADYDLLKRELEAQEAQMPQVIRELQEQQMRVQALQHKVQAKDSRLAALQQALDTARGPAPTAGSPPERSQRLEAAAQTEAAVASATAAGDVGTAGGETGEWLLAERLSQLERESAAWAVERAALEERVRTLSQEQRLQLLPPEQPEQRQLRSRSAEVAADDAALGEQVGQRGG
ncbi:putative Transcription elongation factor SPT4 [Monoraphidium neglectum]|uniref:Putative Transcription elongation factor SPT4 n=1 Tax=Monoraphidium neglectum TaxID=145388 RepID=A0A0D2LA45_9CHLO|nr:putative Transcription elongation factor SPT4 [Monoraphidium neglectum]KIZ03639.1 putative Transcription elongation factor SPT4 [Monoraphidium neglectum]|eukprot:XP_013902658.1 putative Transcription elongation factor SPT4 [Monoraphidium neglectum]